MALSWFGPNSHSRHSKYANKSSILINSSIVVMNAQMISRKNCFHRSPEYVNFAKKKNTCAMNAMNVFLTIEKTFSTMSDNKLVKTIMEAATLTGIAAGIGWASRQVLKEEVTANPATNVMNYVKFTAVMAASIALRDYLEKQKILPD